MWAIDRIHKAVRLEVCGPKGHSACYMRDRSCARAQRGTELCCTPLHNTETGTDTDSERNPTSRRAHRIVTTPTHTLKMHVRQREVRHELLCHFGAGLIIGAAHDEAVAIHRQWHRGHKQRKRGYNSKHRRKRKCTAHDRGTLTNHPNGHPATRDYRDQKRVLSLSGISKYTTPPPHCESNTKVPNFDGNNTHGRSDKGLVWARRGKTPAVTMAS